MGWETSGRSGRWAAANYLNHRTLLRAADIRTQLHRQLRYGRVEGVIADLLYGGWGSIPTHINTGVCLSLINCLPLAPTWMLCANH